jgi:hypothetical protein
MTPVLALQLLLRVRHHLAASRRACAAETYAKQDTRGCPPGALTSAGMSRELLTSQTVLPIASAR